jgi:hypothetical protein
MGATEATHLTIWSRRCSIGIQRAIRKFSDSQTVLVLTFTLLALGQETKPNFMGAWRSISITRGPLTKSITQIKQTASTFAIRVIIPNEPPMDWSIYPTDGRMVTTKSGRNRIERTGHWERNKLILEETGPGNAPWRRSTERQVISLSENGGIMTTRFHNVSDRKGLHDYAIEFTRIEE